MSRFAGTLRDLSERLDLPQPARARVLTEVAGDLEDLYQLYLERGSPEESAEREALGRLDLSDEALRGLARVHGGWFRRLSDSISERAGSRWETGLLGLLVLGTIALSGAILNAVPMSRSAGVWLAPVVGAAVIVIGVGVWKLYTLSLRGDHRPRRLRTGLGAMLGFSVAQFFVAFVGLGSSAIQALRGLGVDPAQAGPLTLQWFQSALALLVMSMSLALVGGLFWFFLLGKVTSIEHDEAAALLAG